MRRRISKSEIEKMSYEERLVQFFHELGKSLCKYELDSPEFTAFCTDGDKLQLLVTVLPVDDWLNVLAGRMHDLKLVHLPGVSPVVSLRDDNTWGH